ncbi:hypothetical protein CKAN_01263500 [Cinnamomum micranthum f. kanehirae]|uniref:DUF674 domain-containing protein n=1 Tax=Cinnamomum micranthum f. kanehirae TaxID=337451 RepID=A0A3S3MHH8_9MAGN|nr:hypothetical protein CKAN_01263500 [Cinnamomum micranthum f. kanehirae]
MNQKFPHAVSELRGAFIAGPAMSMVTDELIVKPLSPISSISLLSKFNIPISDIEEHIVCMGKRRVTTLYFTPFKFQRRRAKEKKRNREEPFDSHSFQQLNSMAAKQMSMSLTLLVDKERKRVIYAESGKDFVETLLSFLTMPLGTVIKLSGKQSNMGSLTMLYQSLEDLDLEFLSTKSCKDMLLHPKSSAVELYKNLHPLVDIGATKPTQYYICSSTVENTQCCCGKTMGWEISVKKDEDVDADGRDGVFVKGKMRFMIRDDLQVSVVSSSTFFAVLREFGISDASVLEERNVNVGEEEVLHLLKRFLLSKTPLTDVFLGELNTVDEVDLDLKVIALDSVEMVQSQTEKEMRSDSGKMIVKLFLSKSNNKVLYAEGGEEIADLLFSFLAFPLGSIVKCLGGCTSMGCLDNLYKSVEDLSCKDCIKSEECKAMLLDPKLAPYFGTKNQLLQIEEQVPCKPNIFYCSSCYVEKGPYITGPRTCSHGIRSIQLSTVNKKFPDEVTELEGAFMAGPAMFMVTDELIVKPLSPISSISLLRKFNIPVSDIEEQIVCIGEKEAISLLKASLISNSVLSNVFYTKKPKQMETKPRRRIFQAHDFI